MTSISRRSLLRTGLTTGALMAAAPILDLKQWFASAADAPTEIRPSLCNGCSGHCGILVHVKNGRVWKVEGHPDHATSKGKLCARAHATLAQVYDADRLTQPLKREGDTFVPISYEQALDEIAERLTAILAQHGPQSVFFEYNPRPHGAFFGPRFMQAIGSPNVMAHSATCNLPSIVGYPAVFGTMPGADLARSKYIIMMGRNPAEGIKTAYTTAMAKAIENGAKVVAIDPRHSATATLSSEWLPIRAGTDLALLLAMANVMIEEKLYDEAFVKEKTNGFEPFAAAMKQYTPEWATEITGIASSTIRRITRELAAQKPNCLIDPGWKGGFGANYNNSTETVRMVGIVNALLGNLAQPGGLTLGGGAAVGGLDTARHPNPPKVTAARMDGAGIASEFPLAPAQGLPHVMAEKARLGKVKAGIVRHHNPIRNFPDPQHMMEGFKQLDLLVVVDPFLSETAMMADYVLPEPSYLEREEIIENVGYTLCMRTKVVEKIHAETRGFEEIITGLADRMDLGKYFNFTLDELNAARLAPHGITLEEMKQKGSITVKAPASTPGVFKLSTPSGKVEFASEKWAKAGFSALPEWIAPKVMPDRNDPHQFRLIHGKQGYQTHSASANNAYLFQIAKDYDAERIWINAGRAARLGIKDGDLVTVKSPLATRTIRAKVTQRIHPEAAYLPAGYGQASPHWSRANGFGISMNDFVPYQSEPMSGHSMMMEVVVEIAKA